MTGIVYGETPPPILPVAHNVVAAFAFHQAFGTLPDNVTIRVYIIGPDEMMIALAGLPDRFILGKRAVQLGRAEHVQPEQMTGQALTFRRHVWDLLRPLFPLRADGDPFFNPAIFLQTEYYTQLSAKHHKPGVTIMIRGDDEE